MGAQAGAQHPGRQPPQAPSGHRDGPALRPAASRPPPCPLSPAPEPQTHGRGVLARAAAQRVNQPLSPRHLQAHPATPEEVRGGCQCEQRRARVGEKGPAVWNTGHVWVVPAHTGQPPPLPGALSPAPVRAGRTEGTMEAAPLLLRGLPFSPRGMLASVPRLRSPAARLRSLLSVIPPRPGQLSRGSQPPPHMGSPSRGGLVPPSPPLQGADGGQLGSEQPLASQWWGQWPYALPGVEVGTGPCFLRALPGGWEPTSDLGLGPSSASCFPSPLCPAHPGPQATRTSGPALLPHPAPRGNGGATVPPRLQTGLPGPGALCPCVPDRKAMSTEPALNPALPHGRPGSRSR